MSFSEETNEDLERLYCDVTNTDELTVSHIRGLPDVIPRLKVIQCVLIIHLYIFGSYILQTTVNPVASSPLLNGYPS